MKILLVITGLGMGGAENQVVALADKFAKNGHSVKIAYLLEPAIVKPKNTNIPVVFLQGNKSIIGMFRAFKNLKKIIKNEGFDVVHSHMFHSNIMTRCIHFFTPIKKLVNTAHSNYEGGALKMLMYRSTDFLCDIFTNVSQNAADSLEHKKAAKKGRIIPVLNGIDCQRFSFNPLARQHIRQDCESKIIFLSIGRLVQAKGYPYLLHAFSQVLKKHNNIELWIVGDGPLKDTLSAIITNLQISTHVKFLGIRSDIPELLSATDFFILPSEWEGFGLVVAEAMACKTFVIATDCGGVKEVMGGNGILVPPKRSDLLENAIIEAINLAPDSIEENNIEAAKHVCDNFNLDTISNKWLKIYDSNIYE